MKAELRRIRAFILDLDGTLYLGKQLFPQTPRFLEVLRTKELRRLFLTNNSSRSTVQYLAKLQDMNIPAIDSEILTSGFATIHYLKKETSHRCIYLLGTPGLCSEFEEHGLEVLGDNHADREPDAVVLGFDLTLTYKRLEKAARFLLAGVPYYATHPDRVCPTETGPIPDTGSMIELLAAATDRRPIVIGKPEQTMIDAALGRLGTEPQETAMVGDRIYTDMLMAQDGGLMSILVLSGETKREDLDSIESQPDLVVEHVGELAGLL